MIDVEEYGDTLVEQLVAAGARESPTDDTSQQLVHLPKAVHAQVQCLYVKDGHVVRVYAYRGSDDMLAVFATSRRMTFYRAPSWSLTQCLIDSGYVHGNPDGWVSCIDDGDPQPEPGEMCWVRAVDPDHPRRQSTVELIQWGPENEERPPVLYLRDGGKRIITHWFPVPDPPPHPKP